MTCLYGIGRGQGPGPDNQDENDKGPETLPPLFYGLELGFRLPDDLFNILLISLIPRVP